MDHGGPVRGFVKNRGSVAARYTPQILNRTKRFFSKNFGDLDAAPGGRSRLGDGNHVVNHVFTWKRLRRKISAPKSLREKTKPRQKFAPILKAVPKVCANPLPASTTRKNFARICENRGNGQIPPRSFQINRRRRKRTGLTKVLAVSQVYASRPRLLQMMPLRRRRFAAAPPRHHLQSDAFKCRQVTPAVRWPRTS